MAKPGFVYILSNKNRTTFYTGASNSVCTRTWRHKNGIGAKFTKKYNVQDLMYYEQHPTMKVAYRREKQLKRWRRAWKIELIQSMNPDMVDLFPTLCPDYQVND
ncbi:MAG: GIY-YIG nuclease family protein [Bacteroidota bacterium]